MSALLYEYMLCARAEVFVDARNRFSMNVGSCATWVLPSPLTTGRERTSIALPSASISSSVPMCLYLCARARASAGASSAGRDVRADASQEEELGVPRHDVAVKNDPETAGAAATSVHARA